MEVSSGFVRFSIHFIPAKNDVRDLQGCFLLDVCFQNTKFRGGQTCVHFQPCAGYLFESRLLAISSLTVFRSSVRCGGLAAAQFVVLP